MFVAIVLNTNMTLEIVSATLSVFSANFQKRLVTKLGRFSKRSLLAVLLIVE